jgi:hypothetical protein
MFLYGFKHLKNGNHILQDVQNKTFDLVYFCMGRAGDNMKRSYGLPMHNLRRFTCLINVVKSFQSVQWKVRL